MNLLCVCVCVVCTHTVTREKSVKKAEPMSPPVLWVSSGRFPEILMSDDGEDEHKQEHQGQHVRQTLHGLKERRYQGLSTHTHIDTQTLK